MVNIKNVAIAGASGDLGKPVLDALVASKKFNITVLTRTSSSYSFPPTVKVTPVDYSSLEELTSALKGQDTLVLTVGTNGLSGQALIIDAAIAAGVYRILPSEFGADIGNSKVAALPVFGDKVKTRKHLEQKIREGAKITYTYVVSGPFLDWGIKTGFLLRWQEGKPTLYNGGETEFCSSTLATIGQAVVGVLSHEEETRNRSVYVYDIVTSQKKLLELAQKAKPEKKFEAQMVDLGELEKELNAKLAKGDYSEIWKYIYLGFGGKGWDAKYEGTDNKLFGIEGVTEDDVEAIWKETLV